jgi:hypothetical protein
MRSIARLDAVTKEVAVAGVEDVGSAKKLGPYRSTSTRNSPRIPPRSVLYADFFTSLNSQASFEGTVV